MKPKPRFHLDVSPLQEPEYTGLSQVAASLCEQLLGDPEVEPAFFHNRYDLPVWLVEALLEERDGALLRWSAGHFLLGSELRAADPGQPVFGLHVNAKAVRRLFPVEGQMIHDLTTLVTPEHHPGEVREYYASRFYGDLLSSDLIVAVSHSTASDVRLLYRDAAAIPLVVAHLGVDWSRIAPSVRDEALDVEPFVFVLGTLEPRKNVEVVLDFLSRDPGFCDRYRVVFGGRVGWGEAFEERLEALGLTALARSGRILQAGFVSEEAKFRLLRHAAAVIYPSVYEGFGLPVAEAVSLGVPVVTTASSSLPEVGRDFAFYFDPDRRETFAAALGSALAAKPVVQGRSGESLEAWRARFTWDRCYRTIRDAFLEVVDRAGVPA